VTLLGKPDCHLCHEMRNIVERVLITCDGTLIERDVCEDPELEKRYRLEIPVLLLGGQELARHRVTEAVLRERLERAGFGGGSAGS
jgi:hypothetical protein